ncbi:MAG TPA: MAPEG family protein [Xanthomonadales bacterium]|nr:MAPEG family protein [Xanthomonadales bacterium]
MTIPVWALLAFASWTLLLLLLTVGIYRWTLILAGRVAIRDFPADAAGGADWYKRATRAHANCIENLPVFGAIVFALQVGEVTGGLVDALAVTIVAARIVQSLVHVCFAHSNTVASFRFTFFFVQFICFAWLIGLVVAKHVGG